jgi:hypothetical protein
MNSQSGVAGRRPQRQKGDPGTKGRRWDGNSRYENWGEGEDETEIWAMRTGEGRALAQAVLMEEKLVKTS